MRLLSFEVSPWTSVTPPVAKSSCWWEEQEIPQKCISNSFCHLSQARKANAGQGVTSGLSQHVHKIALLSSSLFQGPSIHLVKKSQMKTTGGLQATKKEAVTWTSNKRPHILFCKLGSCSCQECSKCQSPLVLSLLGCIIINPFYIHLLESTVSLVRKKPKTGEWRHQATWKQL